MKDYTDPEDVRQDFHDLVAQLSEAGLQARPVVFGRGRPQAALISAEQYRLLAEELDDLMDADTVRQREQGLDTDTLETQDVEDLAAELGVDLRDRS